VDLLRAFAAPVKIVDQVHYEITKPQNDPQGGVAAALLRLHNRIEIVETNVGVGFQAKRARNPNESGANLGEIAVDEYATSLARTSGPNFVPLVLFEDPGVMELRVARLKNVHLLNTTAWLLTLHREGLLPEGLDLVAQINSTRRTPMTPFEKAGLTRKVRSTWLRRSVKPMMQDLSGCSLTDVLDKLEKGKIGHDDAMRWLKIESVNELVEIMHVNGRRMPGHQPMRVPPETIALVRAITRRPEGVRSPRRGTRPLAVARR
jgi:hypothetical protein